MQVGKKLHDRSGKTLKTAPPSQSGLALRPDRSSRSRSELALMFHYADRDIRQLTLANPVATLEIRTLYYRGC
jgi:hypothetical protein